MCCHDAGTPRESCPCQYFPRLRGWQIPHGKCNPGLGGLHREVKGQEGKEVKGLDPRVPGRLGQGLAQSDMVIWITIISQDAKVVPQCEGHVRVF